MSAAEKAGRSVGDRGWLLAAGAISVALAGFAGVLWYAYSVGTQDNGAPLLSADATPIKVKPEAPAGLPPNALDPDIYKLQQRPTVPQPGERVQPPPETPLARPAPPPAPPETQQAAPPTLPKPAETLPAAPNTAARPNQTLDKLIEGILKNAPAAGPTPPPAVTSPPAPGVSPPTAPRQLAQTPARPGAYRVQLVSLQSEEAARQAWTKARASYADLLTGLEGMVTPATLPDNRVVWRVQVGPLANRDAADTLCGALRARKSTCLVLAP